MWNAFWWFPIGPFDRLHSTVRLDGDHKVKNKLISNIEYRMQTKKEEIRNQPKKGRRHSISTKVWRKKQKKWNKQINKYVQLFTLLQRETKAAPLLVTVKSGQWLQWVTQTNSLLHIIYYYLLIITCIVFLFFCCCFLYISNKKINWRKCNSNRHICRIHSGTFIMFDFSFNQIKWENWLEFIDFEMNTSPFSNTMQRSSFLFNFSQTTKEFIVNDFSKFSIGKITIVRNRSIDSGVKKKLCVEFDANGTSILSNILVSSIRL